MPGSMSLMRSTANKSINIYIKSIKPGRRFFSRNKRIRVKNLLFFYFSIGRDFNVYSCFLGFWQLFISKKILVIVASFGLTTYFCYVNLFLCINF
jgi:hypothetical protein